MSALEFHVGQEVILRDRGRETTRRVTRIGRKYVYIDQGYGERAFLKSNGREPNAYGVPAYIGTPEMFAASDARSAAVARVNKALRSWNWHTQMSTDDINRVADLIEGGAS